MIAATNRNLEKEVIEGRFREDLYYRLHVFPIQSIPLRDRKDDIPLLVGRFCDKHGRSMGKRIEQIPQPVLDTLTAYIWPGNIRELETIIERSLITSTGNTLELANWPGQSLLSQLVQTGAIYGSG